MRKFPSERTLIRLPARDPSRAPLKNASGMAATGLRAVTEDLDPHLDAHLDRTLSSAMFRGGLLLLRGRYRACGCGPCAPRREIAADLTNGYGHHLAAEIGAADVMAIAGDAGFTLALHGATTVRRATRTAEAVLERISQAGRRHGAAGLACDIGIALYPADGVNGAALAAAAERALERAGSDHEAGLRFADPEHDARLDPARELRRALRLGQLELHYQPLIALRSGRIGGVEALVRWRGEDGRLRGADQIVPVAEQSNLIIDIDRWVLQQACADAKRWHDAGHRVRLGINVSAPHFRRKSLVGTVADVLHDTGLPPEALELEITETMALDDPQHTVCVIDTLRGQGVRVALDDFGTGYSSLVHLRMLHVDTLKIDRSFVAGCVQSPRDLAIVAAVAGLARRLGLSVVAEGVEHASQQHALQDYCDFGQGYLYGRPVPADTLRALLDAAPVRAGSEPHGASAAV